MFVALKSKCKDIRHTVTDSYRKYFMINRLAGRDRGGEKGVVYTDPPIS